jgi:peptidoglycan biosynthesis protein MviN/MurJ (putative lipid II flippase)
MLLMVGVVTVKGVHCTLTLVLPVTVGLPLASKPVVKTL